MSSSPKMQSDASLEKSLGKQPDLSDSLTDKDLQDLLRHGFHPSNHSVETIDRFAQWRIQIYRLNGYTNSNLSNEVADDFQYFNKTDFDKMAKDVKSCLRDFLRSKGAYVKKVRLFPVSTALFEAVKEELSWPQNDPDYPSQQNRNPEPKYLSSPQNFPNPPAEYHEPKTQPSRSISQSKSDHSNLHPNNDEFQIMPSTQQMTANFQVDTKHEYSRELTTLARLYTNDSQKYDGSITDNITYKYSILNNCKNAGITFDMLPSAFPTMLHGRALEYYYMNCQSRNLSVDNLIACFKEYFEGAQHRRHRLFEWNNINLRNIIHQNPSHDKGKLFIEMVENPRKLQQGLDQEHRTDGAMYNRVISACRTTLQCSFAILQQAFTLPILIDNIYAALQNSDEIDKLEKTEPVNSNTYFTDRKYHRPLNQKSTSSSTYRKNNRKPKKRCFVCQKEGCWSTHHSDKEWLQATMKNRSTSAYIQEWEGNENDQNSETDDDSFDEITLEMQDFDLEQKSENFVTSLSIISSKKAIELHRDLADRAAFHAISKLIPTADKFLVTGRYSSEEFHGIMLDTGAARLSTAGYGQAQAYMSKFNASIDTSSHNKVQAQFGIGMTTSIGILTVNSPIGNIDFHVVQAETPFLLCLQDMYKLGIFFNNLKDVIIKRDGSILPVIRLFMHPFLVWGDESVNYLTETELRQESTSFQAARWLQNMTAGHTWDTLRLCWIDVNSGPPEIIVHDAGSNFDSSEFRMNASSMVIKVKCIPIEAPQSIGLVERYHAPLRRAYSIITDELKGQTSTKVIRLQMAVKAVNDTAGYDSLVPTLLVFGTYPRMSNSDAPTLSTAERVRSIKSAMTEVAKLHAKRQVRDALHQRNGPNISQIHDSPIGSLVLVWRIHQKKWTGPYKLLAIKDETCTVELPSGPTEFRTTIVKPFFEESTTNEKNNKTTENHEPNPNESPTPDSNTTLRRNPARNRRLPGRYSEPDIEIHLIEPSFRSSRLAELNGLLERGVFKLISRHDVPNKSRIFGCRFVDQIKNEGTEKAFEKSRLVVQAYNDAGKGCILTQAPTIQRASQRLILILSLIFDLSIYTRDISQAYTQSNSELARDVYINAPFEMNLC